MLNWCLRCFGALVLTVALSLPALAQTKLALVIGNSAYGSLPVLANPANDAKLIAGHLEKVGFKVTLLTDQGQGQIKSAISGFAEDIEKAGTDTIAAFYYAGHGVQIDGTNYLIPIDVALKTKSDVVLNAVSVSDLLKTLEFARARVNLLVLDACRDNPFASGTRSITRGLARIDAPAGSIVAYATAPGQVAQDGDNGNGPYAIALAENISTPGLSLEDVFRKVRIAVSEKTDGAQMPWEETSLTQEVLLAGDSVAAPVVAAPAPAPTAETDVQSAHAYQLAVGTNTVESYSAFIGKFPTARETALAMRNIEMLNDEANWSKAVTLDTVGSYRNYMTLHADGIYFNEAKERMAALLVKPTPKPKPQPKNIPEVAQPTPPATISEPVISYNKVDVSGTDIRTIRDVSFNECGKQCSSSINCAAAAYRSDLQRCYLKSSARFLMVNQRVDMFIKQALSNSVRFSQFEIVPQMDILGGDMSATALKAQTAQSCLELCESTNGCNAFSFVTSNKSCWLKSGVSTLINAPAIVSGVRRE